MCLTRFQPVQNRNKPIYKGCASLMVLFYSVLAILVTWKWGDWRTWRLYYPTIIFFILISMLHLVLTYEYPQWTFNDLFIPNNTLKALIMFFLQFPCFTILFFTYAPSKKAYLPLYFLIWVTIFGLLEFISLLAGTISYHDGWNFGWSIVLNLCTFPTLYLHHKQPLWGWGVSLLTTAIFIWIFQVPITKMK